MNHNQTETPPAITLTTLPAKVNNSMLIKPVANNQEILAAWHNYQELKRDLLSESDYQLVAGKRCIKKSGWRKLQTAFGLSDELISQERIPGTNPNHFTYQVVVKITAQNGRYAYGVGSCSSTERKFSHPEHDVLTTAHTRSKNRGIADLVGGGEVSAEELDMDTTQSFTKTNVVDVSDVESSQSSEYIPFDEEPVASSAQINLIHKLVDQKLSDEHHRQMYLRGVNELTKQDASHLIKRLLSM